MSTIEPRPQRADARRNRERVVDAARAVFAECGADAQMDDIAARAGVGIGTVYRHFPTKQDLAGEIIRTKFERHLETARAWRARTSGWAALEGFLREVWSQMAEDSTQQRLMWLVDEAAMERFEATRGELVELVGEFVDEAHREGTLRRDFTVDDVPTIMCAVGATMHADMAAMPRNVEGLLDIIVAGLRA